VKFQQPKLPHQARSPTISQVPGNNLSSLPTHEGAGAREDLLPSHSSPDLAVENLSLSTFHLEPSPLIRTNREATLEINQHK